LKPIEIKNPAFLTTYRSCACIQPFKLKGVKRSLNIGRYEEMQRRGTIEAYREDPIRTSAVMKIYIRSALMVWRVNEHVSTTQESNEWEVPDRFQWRIVVAYLQEKQIFEDSFSRTSSSNSVIVAHVLERFFREACRFSPSL